MNDIDKAIEKLEMILCNPDGDVCIRGSGRDIEILQEALTALRDKQTTPKKLDLSGLRLNTMKTLEKDSQNYYGEGYEDALDDVERLQGLLTFWQRVKLFFTREHISIDMGRDECATVCTFKKVNGKIVILSIEQG